MDIFETLRAAANPEQAIGMKAYMRDQFDFLGVQAPLRRKLSREFIKKQKYADWEFIFQCWEQPEREFQYLAIDCLDRLKAALIPADIPNLQKLITAKSWWDTVDGLDVIVGDIAFRHPDVSDTMLKWSTDENIWLRRTAIDHQLSRKDKTDIDLFVTNEDYRALAKKYPNGKKDIWGDLGILVGRYDLLRSVFRLDYDFYYSLPQLEQ